MYIERLELENLRTFAKPSRTPMVFVHPDMKFRSPGETADPDDGRLPRPRLKNVTLLLGDNGSGKTTILRAIAATAFGPVAKDLLRDGSMVRFGENQAKITGSLRLHEQDQNLPEKRFSMLQAAIQLLRRGERLDVKVRSSTPREPGFKIPESLWDPIYESNNASLFIVGYGATRRVERLDSYDSAARLRARAGRDLRVQSLFEEAFSLIPLGSWLPLLKKENPGRYKQVEQLLNKLLSPGNYRFSGEQAENGDYLFHRGDMPVPFQALSDGYRAFVGWVADLLHHVCYGCPSGKKLVDSKGVVLVDEIDLHLHPQWQMKVIPTVARALPNMQFVFTSHSPLVAGSLEWMNILTLKVGSRTNRTTVKRLKQSIHGLDADQILLTDFFGLESTLAEPKRRRLDELTEQIRNGDASAPLQLIRELSSGTEAEE